MDDSEKIALHAEQLAAKDAEIAALQTKNAEQANIITALTAKLVEKTVITAQDAADVEAAKGG